MEPKLLLPSDVRKVNEWKQINLFRNSGNEAATVQHVNVFNKKVRSRIVDVFLCHVSSMARHPGST